MNASRSSRSDARQSLSNGWIGMVKKPSCMAVPLVGAGALACVARGCQRICVQQQGRDVVQNTVGIIGLGIMGGAMARNLVAAGWHVSGHDVDAARCAELAAVGVKIRADAAELAREVPVLLCSLPSPAASLATARAIATSGAERRVVIEASTLALKDKMA